MGTELSRRLGILERYNDALNRGVALGVPLKGPGYEYDPSQSDPLQRELSRAHLGEGVIPKDPQARHRYFMDLSRRGATDFTDSMAERLYIDPSFDCAACIVGSIRCVRAVGSTRIFNVAVPFPCPSTLRVAGETE